MIELNKIYNIDCIKGLKMIPNNFVDLVVTSPPYCLGIDYDSYNDNMPWNEYLDWIKVWIGELQRVSKPDGRICINHYINFQDKQKNSRFPLMDIRNIQEEVGLKTHKIAVWNDITRSRFTAFGSWLKASAPYINCVLPNTLILTQNGYKNIECVEKGDKVLTHNNNYKEILEVYNQNFKGDIIDIELYHNKSQKINTTLKHKLYVKKRSVTFKGKPYNRKYIFSDVHWSNGREIYDQFKNSEGRVDDIRYYLSFPKNKKSELPEWVKDDELYRKLDFWILVGYFLAEGNLTEMKNYIRKQKQNHTYELILTSYIKEKEEYEKLFKRLNINYWIKNNQKSFHLYFYSKKLYIFFTQFFKIESFEVKGTKSHLKIIPNYIQDFPREYIEQLINGYHKGDGDTFMKRNAVGYNISSSSYDLLLSVQRLLLKLNKFSTIKNGNKEKDTVICGRKTKVKKSYTICWYDHQTKWKKVLDDDNFFYFPIKYINLKEYEGKVYDLSVKDDESYCSINSIMHNSPYEGVLISYKEQWHKINKGESTISKEDFLEACSGVWNIGTTRGKTKACFPLKLPQLCIDFLSYKGDVILDPFMGSGTTAVAAKKSGRNYIGFEISKNYCDISEKWLNEI